MNEHKRNEQEGLRWELLFQAVGQPALILDPEHTIIAANDAAADATGLSREELVGKKCYEVFHESSHPPERCPLEAMKQSGQVETEAMEVEALGGTYLVSCTPVFDDKGHLNKVVHIATDITERKRVQDKLQENEKKYRELFNTALVGITVHNAEGNITAANDTAERIFGITEKELMEKDLDFWTGKLLHPDGTPMDVSDFPLSIVAETKAPSERTVVGLRMAENEEPRWFLHSARPIVTKEGNLEKVVTSFIDITDRRKTREALHESKRFLQDVFDGIQDGISVLGPDLTIVRVNEWIKKRHHDELPLEGKKCYQVYQRRDSPCPVCPSVEALSTGEVHTEEIRVPTPGGAFWSEISAYPLKDEQGQVVGVIEHVKDVTERKEAIEKLRESEEKYRSLFYGTPLGTFRYDERGVITDCNETFVDIIGSSKEALIGLNMMHDLEDEDLVEEVKYSLADGEGYYEGKYTSVTADKTTPVRVLFKGMRNEEGNIYAGMGLVEDITDRKQAEENLRESERQMRTLMGNLPGMAYRCRNVPSWTMEFVSDGCRQVTGYEPEKVMNDTVVAYGDVIHPDDRDMVWKTVQQAVDAGERFELEYRIITKQGEERWVWERGTCVSSGEEPAILEGFISDITARKKAEQRYRSVVENAHDAIYLIHPEEGFQYVNPAFEDLTGYSAGEIYSDTFSFWDIIHPDDVAMIEERGKARARGEEVPDRYEFRIIAQNGDVKIVEATTVDVATGEVLVMGILRDVTKRWRAEQERERAYQEMERALQLEKRFKADAAHFFLNPIAICKGYLELHMNQLDGRETKQVEMAREAIMRIEAVIKNIVEKGEIRE